MGTAYTNKAFDEAIDQLQEILLLYGEEVNTSTWQSKKSTGGEFNTIEVLNQSFTVQVPESIEALQEDIKPNLPWAEDHFQERVGGEPLNPGIQYKNWPYYKDERGMREVLPAGNGEPLFSHTYMERFWTPSKPGIRYAWGNLDNVIELLIKDPMTRQAYLPIWFPEDTGAGGNNPRRVPCTLGYHFLGRKDGFHMWYDIRSCDILRHLNDDIYLAARLLQWVLSQLVYCGSTFWHDVKLGTLTMNIHSLHMFTVDRPTLLYKRKTEGRDLID